MSVINEKDECSLIETLKSHIPNVEDLLNPAVEESEINLFETDSCAIDESHIEVIGELKK